MARIDLIKSTSQKINLGEEEKYLKKIDLVGIQKQSWQHFLDKDLERIIKNFFPIKDYTEKKIILYFEGLFFGKPRYSSELCYRKKLTYDRPIYIKVKSVNLKTGEERKQDVYFFNLPIMTKKGIFIINGIERAIINQIVRSPGVYFTASVNRSTGLKTYNAEIRPYIGAWIDITINKNNLIEIKINKRRKFYITTFIKIFGENNSQSQILNLFKGLDKKLIDKYLIPTLKKDRTNNHNEAILEVYKKIRPGEPLILENAVNTLKNLFFNPKRYSLEDVGRYKINKKLSLHQENDAINSHLLNQKDIVETVKYLLNLIENKGNFDNIDHLGNRRIRAVGELVAMYGIRVGMIRTERETKERMSLVDGNSGVSPSQIINSKSLTVAINRFYRTSQLSTIVDQTNPLSELDNLRRITVGGPGGIAKKRASFSIRDISSSQYGRICPIRSPEGQNIGVVTYLAMYARLNKYGFLETPYRKVKVFKEKSKTKVKIVDEIVYLQADDEEKYFITSANIGHDSHNYITQKTVTARHHGDIVEVSAEKLNYIDISPRQVFGISAALIPFLQNDDASRALMGSHMQCQALPLVKPRSAIVNTGLGGKIASSLGRTVRAEENGQVTYVDAKKVIIKGKSGQEYHYQLERFKRTTKNVVFDQRPVINLHQKVKKNEIIIDGPATERGDLAIGQNLVVAYTSFEGLGYEDGFVISERLIKEDSLTSITSEEFVCDLINTKLGPEELTRDIPNVREEILQNLNKDGFIIEGTEVKGGDILVGKVAPRGERELTAEERLLKAIFGEKAKDIKDTSLHVPYGKKGVVTNIEIIDGKKDPNELEPSVLKRILVTIAELRRITVGDKLAGRHGNKGVIAKIVPEWDMPYLEDGRAVDIILSPLSILSRINLGQLFETLLGIIAYKNNKKISIPVFKKIKEEFISQQLKKVGYPVDGQVALYNPHTGQPYERPVLVGVSYIMKLIHMVEDKFHARSVGPYSLVSQQPLGGKSQMGGQRFGEMEVWALESHRVPHTLQEMLTIKSDDVRGRTKAFESIVKGLDIPQSSVPESFHVLLKELNALGLSVDPVK